MKDPLAGFTVRVVVTPHTFASTAPGSFVAQEPYSCKQHVDGFMLGANVDRELFEYHIARSVSNMVGKAIEDYRDKRNGSV